MTKAVYKGKSLFGLIVPKNMRAHHHPSGEGWQESDTVARATI